MATIKFPNEMPVAGAIAPDDKMMISKAATGEAYQATFNDAKNFLEITGNELEPIASGALPTPPVGQVRTMNVVGPPADVNGNPQTSIWTHPTLPTASLKTGQTGKFFWDVSKWRLRNVQDLPKAPVKNEYGNSTIDAASQKLVTELKENFDSKISVISNEEFIYALVSPDNTLLWGKRRDGSTYDVDLSQYIYTDEQVIIVKNLISRLSIELDLVKASISALEVSYSALKRDFDDKFAIVTNAEWAYGITTHDNTLLWGVRHDGSIYSVDTTSLNYTDEQVRVINLSLADLNEKIDSNSTSVNSKLDLAVIELNRSLVSLKNDFDNKISIISNAEYIYGIVASDNTLLWGKRRDGSTYDIDNSLYESNKKTIDELSNIVSALDAKVTTIYNKTMYIDIVTNPEYFCSVTDANGKLIEAIRGDDGVKVIQKAEINEAIVNTLTTSKIIFEGEGIAQLQQDLKDAGFKSGAGDWSDAKEVRLPISKVSAKINIISSRLPTTKIDNIPAQIEYYDFEGNYFKKPVTINAQGSSSMAYDKKNIAIDLTDGSAIKFGDWVIQDSWHMKAHYTDTLKVNNNSAYSIFEELARKRPYISSRVWDYSFQDGQTTTKGTGVFKDDFDTGARGFPDGFPCSLYHNGSFYGIYFFNLKKHRDNYKTNRGSTVNIHLDGTIGAADVFNGTIVWSQFEVRNPSPRLKNEGWELLDIDGNKYDSENPKELGETGNTGLVKTSIQRLADSLNAIKANPTKSTFESYFANTWMFMDYLIISNIVGNGDAFQKNWQWLTYDGVKWTIAPYDWDGGFGVDHLGNYMGNVTSGMLGVDTETPMKYFWQIYKTEIKARYQELKNSGFISTENIFSFYKKYMDWIGYENYDKENKKWKDMPSYRNPKINTQWKLKANTVVTSAINYNSETIYAIGSEVVYGVDAERYVFVANEAVTGVPPLSGFYPLYPRVLGFYNSESRIYRWLDARIAITNNLFS